MRVQWAARRSNQSILMEINPEYSLEGMMLKMKMKMILGRLVGRADLLERSRGWERQEEKGMTDDDMIGWHHQLNGHEFGQTPGDSEGQRELACCNPWGHKE